MVGMKVVILSTRIAGNDGVSLEAHHWKDVLTKMGHTVTFVAGKLDTDGYVIPELSFQNPKVVRMHDNIVYKNVPFSEIEPQVFAYAGVIEGKLRELFQGDMKPDLLIVKNVFSIPMHFPLAIALARVIQELNINTIARHHDFWWERERFLKSEMFDFWKRWFPPQIPQITHVVINSIAQKELKERMGIDATIIWDSFDFSIKPKMDQYARHFRSDFRIGPTDKIILQATRIVPRKRIELAIELVAKLNDPRVVFVCAGYAGDEAGDYEKKLKRLAKEAGIRYRFIGNSVNSHRRVLGTNGKRKRIYTLWDAFLNADLVTYPTELEGFGNQFVETMYFGKPIVVTPYPVFEADIAPLGFDYISMPNMVTPEVLKEVRETLSDQIRQKEIARKNFSLGKQYLSYGWVEKKLEAII